MLHACMSARVRDFKRSKTGGVLNGAADDGQLPSLDEEADGVVDVEPEPEPAPNSGRRVRERYLTSILRSLLIHHKPGNTILEDYPVSEAFKDALKEFPAKKKTSIRELGFEPVKIKTPKGEDVLIFRPVPFMKVDEVDDSSDFIFRLRPPISSSASATPASRLPRRASRDATARPAPSLGTARRTSWARPRRRCATSATRSGGGSRRARWSGAPRRSRTSSSSRSTTT